MGATTSDISSPPCIYPIETANEKLKPDLELFWLHICPNDDDSIPIDIFTQQQQVDSFIGNIDLKIFTDEIELDGYIREMTLMNKAILIVNGIAAFDAIRRVHDRCQIALILVYNVTINEQQQWNNYNKVRYILLEQILPRIQSFYARWLRHLTECFSFDIFNSKSDKILDRSSTDINGSFFFSQLFFDIILKIKSDPIKDRKEFVEEYTKQFLDQKEEFKS